MLFRVPSSRVFDSCQSDSRVKAGLVGHWVGGGSGNTWFDKSGYGNHGALTNGSLWTLGRDGKNDAVFFDGVNDYVSLGSPSSLNLASDISVFALVNLSSVSSLQGIVSQSTSWSGGQYELQIGRTAGKVEITWGNSLIATASNSISINTWTHIGFTRFFNGTNYNWVLYINGVADSSGTSSVSPGSQLSCDIGAGLGHSSRFAGGIISDVRIYNRALSQAEVSILSSPSESFITTKRRVKTYKPPTRTSIARGGCIRKSFGNAFDSVNTDPRLRAGLIGHWTDCPPGNIWQDRSGYGNHGKLTNGPKWTLGSDGLRNCLLFDASDDYIDIGSNYMLSASSPCTICWWEKVTSTSLTFNDRFNLKINGSTREFLAFRTEFSGYGNFAWIGQSGGSYFVAAGTPTRTSSIGIWRHWTLVCFTNPTTASSSDWAVYVDGVYYAPSGGGGSGFSGNTHNQIGGSAFAGEAADCAMDDIRIYNRALSGAEISLLAGKHFDVVPPSKKTIVYANIPVVQKNICYVKKPNNPRVFDNVNLDNRFKNGLLGHWTTGAQGRWLDRSGYANHGILTSGAYWTLGQDNKRDAVFFDGTNDYIDIGSSINASSTASIACWIKCNDVTTTRTIFSGGGNNGHIQFEIGRTSGKLSAVWSGAVILTGSTTLSSGNWYHVSLVRAGSFGPDGAWTINLYVNGQLDATTTTASNPNTSAGLSYTIGCRSDRVNFYSGIIDDIRLYNRALSQAEVYGLFDPSFSIINTQRKILGQTNVVTTINSDMTAVFENLLTLISDGLIVNENTICINSDAQIVYENLLTLRSDGTLSFENLLNLNKDGELTTEFLLSAQNDFTAVFENLLTLISDGLIVNEKILVVNNDAQIVYENLLTLRSDGTLSFENLLNLNKDGQLTTEFLLSARNDFTAVFENLLTLISDGLLIKENNINLNSDAQIVYENLLTLRSDGTLSFENLLNLNKDGQLTTEFLLSAQNDFTAVYENLIDLNSDAVITFEQLLSQNFDGQLTYEKVLSVIHDEVLTLEHLLSLYSDGQITNEWLKQYVFDAVITDEILSSVNTNGVFPISWGRDISGELNITYTYQIEEKLREWAIRARVKTWVLENKNRIWRLKNDD